MYHHDYQVWNDDEIWSPIYKVFSSFSSLAQFLCLSQYNQHFVLRELVNKHCDNVIKEVFEDQMKLSPLELYAISRLPENLPIFFVILFCRCLALLKSKKVDDINDGYQML